MSTQWGLYFWLSTGNPEKIHPDDLEKFKQVARNSRVFECLSTNEEYIALRYGGEVFRVKPESFHPISAPKYDFYQKVKIKEKDMLGTIEDIYWHFDNAAHFYFVSVDGKKKRRRYYEDELEAVEA